MLIGVVIGYNLLPLECYWLSGLRAARPFQH